ncbi:MAG: leucine-rich repeat domain-containing protein [Clostridia bacterium]|nr:leucine-rich repeat domain-containing protein [Clostridia bacterium]MBQ7761895.1 leucine-rich repeat domain-containing protein [Clostridia bacterium]
MKKKLLLVVSMVALLVCLLAISVSAETVLKPQDNNAYGELSFFDESITVGRTDSTNGFTPYMEDGETYARVVIGDGTTFYTFPTYYIMEKNAYESGSVLWQYSFTSLNSAMETATDSNPGWNETNVYRLEFPTSVKYVTGVVTQCVQGFSNLIELTLAPNMTTVSTNQNCLFRYNPNLEVIYNIETFVFKKGCLQDAFYNDAKLTSLTLAYSPEVTGKQGNIFRNCSALVSVNFNEAFPNLQEFGTSAFENCNKLKTISSSRNDGVFELSSKISYIENNAFANCDSVKAIKFTGSSLKILQSSFHSMDSLEFVYFPRESTLNLPSCEVFSNNTNLKAVAFPDDCTLIPDRGFKNCTNLKAVYLPANLYELKTNGGGHGAFAYNNNMYFVQDWFNVLDENGEFLFDSFVQPTRPDVYYFPNTLTLFYKRDSGTGFDANYNLNPVMVLPTTVKELWVYDGCFYDCGKTGNKFTIVCLGDMENVRIGMRENRAKGISYVFANPADTDLSCVTIVDTNANYSPSLNGDESVFFCASNKYFTLYNLGGSSDDTQYTNDNTTLEVDATKHISSPRATVVSQADCTLPEGSTFYCFCGIKTGEEITSPALGHLQSSISEIVYEGVTKFFEAGDIEYYCERCEQNHTEGGVGQAKAIFAFVGYSATEIEMGVSAIIQGFKVDHEALALYNENTDFTVVGYGLVAGTVNALGENADIFDSTGAVTAQKAGVVNISARAENYDMFEMRVSGLSGIVEVEGADPIDLAKVKVYCCGYCLIQTPAGVASYYANNGSITETLSGASSYEDLTTTSQQ